MKKKFAMSLLCCAAALATSCTSSPGEASEAGTGAASAEGSTNTTGSDEGGWRCKSVVNTDAAKAGWTRGEAPNYFLRLTDEFDLPPQLAGIADPQDVDGFGGNSVNASFPSPYGGLVQYQDKTVGVVMPTGRTDLGTPDAQMDVAVVGQDGGLISQTHYVERDGQDLPEPFDLANKQTSGYFRVGVTDGVDITPAAAGDKDEKVYLTSALADAFDDSVVWVLSRGSAKLYKASLWWSLSEGAPGDAGCIK